MKKIKDFKKKTAYKWVRDIILVITAVLYYKLNWITVVQNINKYLDAVIRSLFIIAISSILQEIVVILIGYAKITDARMKTVRSLVASIIKYAIAIITAILVLTLFVKDTASIFTGVGVMGLIVGLGCNKLISDVVAGIFIVFEGDFQVGDVVVIDGWRGTVENIGVRTTRIVSAEGNIKIINNSNISDIVNNSRALSIAVCDVGIEYDESIERVEAILAKALPKMKEKIPAIKEGPFYKGISELGNSSVVIKIVAKTTEDDKFQVQRDLNREIKLLFDENQINIPFNQITLSQRVDFAKNATTDENK